MIDNNQTLNQKSKTNKSLLILVIILVIIAVILAIIFIYLNWFLPKEPSPTPAADKSSYLVKVTRECSYLQNQIEIQQVITKTNEAIYVQANLSPTEIEKLQNQECVLGIYPPDEAREELARAKDQLATDVTQDIRRWKLKRTLEKKDLSDKETLKDYLLTKHPEVPPTVPPGQTGVISPYQLYVTPTVASIQNFSNQFNNSENLYLTASNNWIWVAEQTLNGVSEQWLYPDEFLTQTPSFPTNPLPGQIVSDCSEQANTLASALRASGVPVTDVRVTLGIVNFDGVIGGHAWVELKQDNIWMALDATSGPFYDDETGQLINQTPIPFDYFLYHEFPVVERWYYYNDQYFKDLSSGQGNAPQSWAVQASFNQPLEFNNNINIIPLNKPNLQEKILKKLNFFD